MASKTDESVKQQLLTAAQQMLSRGLVTGTAGNLSARLPDGHVALTPAALDYDSMTLDDLVVCDLDGNVIEGTRNPTTEIALHLACLRQHGEVGALVHCHATYSTMFAVTHQPIPCVIEEFDIYVGGDVPVAKFEHTGSEALGAEAARWLAKRRAVLMANHGLLTAGDEPLQALELALLVERAAQIVWGARLLGELQPLPPRS